MGLRDQILKWDTDWRYDFWWREKYNVPFNSKAHREVSQIDIKMDYIEKMIARNEHEKYEQYQENEKLYKDKKIWLRDTKVDKEKQERLFKHITLDNI